MAVASTSAEGPFVEYLTDEGLHDQGTNEVHPLIVHLTSNYVIMRSILSHLDWREQASCAQVCQLWRDTVHSLRKENPRSYDFVVHVRKHPVVVTTLSSEPLLARPLFAVAFYNAAAMNHLCFCRDFSAPPCSPPCENKHRITAAVKAALMSKKADLISINASQLIYMPCSGSKTAQFTIRTSTKSNTPFLGGLYVPRIPNVGYYTLQYSNRKTLREDVYNKVDEICETNIIKGLLVFVEDQFLLLENDSLEFLNYFKTKQPDVAFAMGGCVVEMVSGGAAGAGGMGVSTVTMVVVTSPRVPAAASPACEFHMHSLVIDNTVFKKAAIQKCIETFSQSVPELEYSAALKLSCIGRTRTHAAEQELYRAAFPRTAIVGCYGNGELGYSVPPPRAAAGPAAKRRRQAGEPDFSYAYSTVFVHFAWGKAVSSRAN